MPADQDPEGDDGLDGSTGSRNVQQLRRQVQNLEQQLKDLIPTAKAAEAAEARAAAAEAQVATFTKAASFDRLGIPSTGAGKLFRDTYQGELTDEAIVAAASSYEIVPAPSQATQSTIPGVDQDAWARMQASLPGASTQAGQPQGAVEMINAAQTPEQVDALLARFGVLGGSNVVVTQPQ